MIKPPGAAPFVQTEQQQEVEDGDNLPDRLVFAKAVGWKNDAFGGGELAEACDEKFAADDDNGHPGWNRRAGFVVDGYEADEGCRGENLVHQRVHQCAEIRDEVAAAGK